MLFRSWEAIGAGKPVLVFGYAWYRSLPGAIPYHPAISLAEILDCKINHDVLEAQYNQLMRKSRRGIVDPDYRTADKNYDAAINTKRLLNFLQEKTSVQAL